MSIYEKSSLNKVVRGSKRASYDVETIHEILDSHFICHVAYVYEGTPITIPTGYGRKGNTIYLHGALKNRMLNSLLECEKISMTVTHLDGIVMARSVFHHSFNYRSAVVFGEPRLVLDESEKMEALEIITENIIKGRWNEARLPNQKELDVTAVLALEIESGSAKIRAGGPLDEKEDYDLDVWAGVLPMKMTLEEPIPDEAMTKEFAIANSLVIDSR